MEIPLELFITVSLSFMFTFVFGKLVSMATAIEDQSERAISSASAMKPDLEPEAGLKSLVDSIEISSFEEEEEINGESIEVARFQGIPDPDRTEFAVEESKRLVEFHRQVMVSDSEHCGFRKGICEIEIELVENMAMKTDGENLEEEEDENQGDREIGDWVEIERKDLEMFGENDSVASGCSEKN